MRGFVAGTLVHTDKGLVPIKEIKIGDMVLSRDQDIPDGELVYKPVLHTIVSENVPIYFAKFTPSFVDNLRFRERMNPLLHVEVLSTANHPFRVENKAWINAEQLEMKDKILFKNGETAYFRGGDSEDNKIDVIFKTDKQNVGYIPDFHSDMNSGRFVDLDIDRTLSFGGYDPVFRKLFIEDTEWRERLLAQTPEQHREQGEFYGFRQGFWQNGAGTKWAENEGLVTTTVYNIEVADTHTYFISEQGVWVHQ